MLRKLSRLMVRLCAIVGFLVLLTMTLGVLGTLGLIERTQPLPDKILLSFDFSIEIAEGGPSNLAESLMGAGSDLADVVAALDMAANDPRVTGLVAQIDDAGFGLAQAQELRAAVERFRATDKFAIVHATSFGELMPGNRPYYLAAAFDHIYLQPVGFLGLSGIALEGIYLGEVLKKLGITARFLRRGDYKTFPDIFTRKGISEAERTQSTRLTADLADQLFTDIADDRGLSAKTVRALADTAPLTAREAKAAGLVDIIGYADEAEDAARKRAGADAQEVDLLDYARAAAQSPHLRAATKPPVIARVHVSGPIMRGGGIDPLMGGGVTGIDTTVEAIRQATETKDIDALILRIDSPGGSAVASETLHHAIETARKDGLKVVVSMGDTCASGGYWAAVAADRIVAGPASITGSIGVFGGKFVFEEALEMLGIGHERIEQGAAGLFSPLTDFTPEQEARLDALMADIYDQFLDRVEAGRRIDRKKLEQTLAGGRVWTGREAAANGLVDKIGGLYEAEALAKELAGIAPDAPVVIRDFPEPKGRFEMLMETLEQFDRVEGGLARIHALLDAKPGDSTVRLPFVLQ